MRKDLMIKFHEFAQEVANALNAQKVVREDEENIGYAVIVMVATPPPQQPYGGSINFREGKWQVDPQLLDIGSADEN